MYTRRERSLGNIWEACHEISEKRPSAFHRFGMKYHWATLGLIHSGEKPYECNLCGKLSAQTHLNVPSTHDKSVQRNTHIRNVKTPLHKHSHYWANNGEVLWMQQESLNVLSVFERFSSTGKSSIFPILRKLRTPCTEYKDWGNAFNDTFYIRKNIKYSLDAKPVSVLILEDLSMIPLCWLVRIHSRGRP